MASQNLVTCSSQRLLIWELRSRPRSTSSTRIPHCPCSAIFGKFSHLPTTSVPGRPLPTLTKLVSHHHLPASLTLTMGCLPSRHQLNNFKEERRQAMVERRVSRRMSEKGGNGYLAPPQRSECSVCLNAAGLAGQFLGVCGKAELTLGSGEEESSGRSTPQAVWTEDDTYIPRFDSTLPRLR
jgi:hypothetical protein